MRKLVHVALAARAAACGGGVAGIDREGGSASKPVGTAPAVLGATPADFGLSIQLPAGWHELMTRGSFEFASLPLMAGDNGWARAARAGMVAGDILCSSPRER